MSESKDSQGRNVIFLSCFTQTVAPRPLYSVSEACLCFSSLRMYGKAFEFPRVGCTNFDCDINTQSHTLQHVLYVVVSVNSAVSTGLWQQWTALFDNVLLDSAATLFIVQPVSWLKVDSNLCFSFGLLVGTDSLLCLCRPWPPSIACECTEHFVYISYILIFIIHCGIIF